MAKILVVDDERDIQDLFLQRFRKEIKSGGLEFNFAFSGEEALDYMKSNNHKAVIILSDINMPGMSGLDLLWHIKHDYKNPPPVVMMITAYGDSENYNQAMQYGADGYLTKPLDFALLKEKLVECCNQMGDGLSKTGTNPAEVQNPSVTGLQPEDA